MRGTTKGAGHTIIFNLYSTSVINTMYNNNVDFELCVAMLSSVKILVKFPEFSFKVYYEY
jgi:hypothetical protein